MISKFIQGSLRLLHTSNVQLRELYYSDHNGHFKQLNQMHQAISITQHELIQLQVNQAHTPIHNHTGKALTSESFQNVEPSLTGHDTTTDFRIPSTSFYHPPTSLQIQTTSSRKNFPNATTRKLDPNSTNFNNFLPHRSYRTPGDHSPQPNMQFNSRLVKQDILNNPRAHLSATHSNVEKNEMSINISDIYSGISLTNDVARQKMQYTNINITQIKLRQQVISRLYPLSLLKYIQS